MTRGVLAVTILVGIGYSIGCQPKQTTAALSETDRRAIRQALEGFIMNAQATPRDDKASAAYYEESAILVAPNHAPVEGRTAIEAFLSAFPPFSNYQLHVLELEGRGDLAYERGTNSMTLMIPKARPAEWRSNYLVIWHKQADGSWKVSREIFTPAPPPAEQVTPVQ